MVRSSSLVFGVLVSTLLVAFVACGGEGDADPGPTGGTDPQQGFTSCGNFPDMVAKSCQPGQYCADAAFSECKAGCLSNVNCASDQTCQKAAGETTGACQNNATTTSSSSASSSSSGGGGGNNLARCQDACKKMLQCGLLDAADGAQCTNECSEASDVEQKTIADCVEPWTCNAPIPGCLDPIVCGPSYPCPAGQDCLAHTCL